jgi:hypothetical protein
LGNRSLKTGLYQDCRVTSCAELERGLFSLLAGMLEMERAQDVLPITDIGGGRYITPWTTRPGAVSCKRTGVPAICQPSLTKYCTVAKAIPRESHSSRETDAILRHDLISAKNYFLLRHLMFGHVLYNSRRYKYIVRANSRPLQFYLGLIKIRTTSCAYNHISGSFWIIA